MREMGDLRRRRWDATGAGSGTGVHCAGSGLARRDCQVTEEMRQTREEAVEWDGCRQGDVVCTCSAAGVIRHNFGRRWVSVGG